MKIKTDFVTNSSSSSFIVVFPKPIQSTDDLINYMDMEKAKVVLRDALDQFPIKIEKIGNSEISLFNLIDCILKRNLDEYLAKEILDEITEAIKDEFPSILIPIDKLDEMIFQLQYFHHDRITERCDEELKELILNNEGFIYTFLYSDESGPFWSEMEHGGTFRKLPHIRINNH